MKNIDEFAKALGEYGKLRYELGILKYSYEANDKAEKIQSVENRLDFWRRVLVVMYSDSTGDL